jgi:cyclopropane fatty-acyl-phospholipid synthase-like methyltransferase
MSNIALKISSQFMNARVIQVACKLDVFTFLSGGQKTAAEISAGVGIQPRT